MSDFSPEWLALREPADRRARDQALAERLRTWFASRDHVTVLDLGCGTGSNLRATAPWLPDRQTWRLIDHDEGLLAAARARLMAWADDGNATSSGLALRTKGQYLTVSFARCDLARDIGDALAGDFDLATAAALFDLVSADWMARLVDALAGRRAPLYALLTYDGTNRWDPAHPLDDEMLVAFHAHQGRDKGFGPAAGPRAATCLADALMARGYDVHMAPSPWRLTQSDGALTGELARGFAQAVRETRMMEPADVDRWLAFRLENGIAWDVGHVDLLGLPGRR